MLYHQSPFGSQSETPCGESRQRAALSYVLGFFSGAFFLLRYRQDSFVRFHALQSIGFSLSVLLILFLLRFIVMNSLVLSLLSAIKLTTILVLLLLYMLPFVLLYLWIQLIWRAYQGEKIKALLIGTWLERHLGV